MRRDLVIVLAVLIAALGASGAGAIGDCSTDCTYQTDCSTDCIDGELLNTCGGYGVCYVSPDSDNDGVYNFADNCEFTYNPTQADCDGDGVGDACDGENGTFQLLSAGPCYIRNNNYLLYIAERRYVEGLYRDTSSCNSPDKWVALGSQGVTCVGVFWSSSDCCVSHWPASECSALLGNNVCHN